MKNPARKFSFYCSWRGERGWKVIFIKIKWEKPKPLNSRHRFQWKKAAYFLLPSPKRKLISGFFLVINKEQGASELIYPHLSFNIFIASRLLRGTRIDWEGPSLILPCIRHFHCSPFPTPHSLKGVKDPSRMCGKRLGIALKKRREN